MRKLELSLKSPRLFWGEINSLCNTSRRLPNIHPDLWCAHFKHVFQDNGLVSVDDVFHHSALQYDVIQEVEDILFNGPVTEAKVRFAINHLNVNKSYGGNLLPQHILYGSEFLIPFILQLFNRIFVNGEFPLNWAEFIIVPLHKKGNVNNQDNYRGIALVDVLSKLYISILTKRVSFYVEIYDKISECQAGFRSVYSTIDSAFVFYSIISKCLNVTGKSIYIASVDFRKAFDSADLRV